MAYSKPTGYNTAVKRGAGGYKPNNGYLGPVTQSYGPLATALVLTMTFSAAPADTSQITAVPDGAASSSPSTPSKTFTFAWNGAPGTGVIPLVAGGGTAAQAATAAQVAMSAQLVNWIVTNPSAGVLVLTQRLKGANTTGTGLAGSTNITIVTTAPTLGAVLPARTGARGATLSG